MIVLASRSPRRRALLEWAGHTVVAVPSGVDETRDPADAPAVHAVRLAEAKAAVRAATDSVVVAADTVVAVGDMLFEIPVDRAQARAHLRALSGREHEVTTGVCVRRGPAVRSFAVSTRVRFRRLSEVEIERYVETGEADDKAGAYGIQGLGGAFVAEVHGSWTNVMGLPLEETLAAIETVAADAASAVPVAENGEGAA